jgi:hypothetical protein
MSREEIIRMAREAGFVVDEKAQQHQPNCIFHTWHMIDEGLARFAKLVYEATFRDANIAASRTIIDAAVLHEREACAKVAEAYEPRCDTCPSGVANAIRARGQAQFNRNAPSELHGY